MRRRALVRRMVCGLIAAMAIAATGAASASAAPPANDNRADAQDVAIPSTVDGTTVESTQEPEERGSSCAADAGSVWYRVKPKKGRVIVQLQANGALDATMDVYR